MFNNEYSEIKFQQRAADHEVVMPLSYSAVDCRVC